MAHRQFTPINSLQKWKGNRFTHTNTHTEAQRTGASGGGRSLIILTNDRLVRRIAEGKVDTDINKWMTGERRNTFN